MSNLWFRLGSHENDVHIQRLIQHFVSAAIEHPEIGANIAQYLSTFLLSVAKVRWGSAKGR